MTTFNPQPSLQSVLKLDATVCLAMGGGFVLLSGPVAQLTLISAPLLF